MKVLVVDDSPLMRRYLREILTAEPDIEVEVARDGRHALERVAEVDPDVITLDINMPEMDGLTCLAHLMNEHPRPVVMLSSLTESGALATLEALELGAVDFVHKPGGTVSHDLKTIGGEIVAKVRAARRAKRRLLPRRPARPDRGPVPPMRAPRVDASAPELVLVGVSTGGPSALDAVLTRLSASFPAPILVAQHMPGAFTKIFAERLDRAASLRVVEVDRPTPLAPGTAYVARGDADVLVERRLGRLVAVSVPAAPSCAWHPCVDRMVDSALDCTSASRMIGVLLTGMGDDGARAMTKLRRRGGRTIAEAESTAVVFGMPQELIASGGADAVLGIDRVASVLSRWAVSTTTETMEVE